MTSLEIKDIIQCGQRFELPALRLYVHPNRFLPPKTACIVGKKVHRSAVVRHRYQRLLREAVRAAICSGVKYDMVVVAKPEILTLKKLSELQNVLKPCFENLT